jgi:tRNA threonylcarbamoyladenosine biosynthesis protein TsaB
VGWQPNCFPSARHVAVLGAAGMQAGHAIAPEEALPVYIRNDVAIKQKKF